MNEVIVLIGWLCGDGKTRSSQQVTGRYVPAILSMSSSTEVQPKRHCMVTSHMRSIEQGYNDMTGLVEMARRAVVNRCLLGLIHCKHEQ